MVGRARTSFRGCGRGNRRHALSGLPPTTDRTGRGHHGCRGTRPARDRDRPAAATHAHRCRHAGRGSPAAMRRTLAAHATPGARERPHAHLAGAAAGGTHAGRSGGLRAGIQRGAGIGPTRGARTAHARRLGGIAGLADRFAGRTRARECRTGVAGPSGGNAGGATRVPDECLGAHGARGSIRARTWRRRVRIGHRPMVPQLAGMGAARLRCGERERASVVAGTQRHARRSDAHALPTRLVRSAPARGRRHRTEPGAAPCA